MLRRFNRYTVSLFFCLFTLPLAAEKLSVSGEIWFEGRPLPQASVGIVELNMSVLTDSNGEFSIEPVEPGEYTLSIVHPYTFTEKLDITVKRHFEIKVDMRRKADLITSEPYPTSSSLAPGYSYTPGKLISYAPAPLGYSRSFITSLPSFSRNGLISQKYVLRSQPADQLKYSVNGIPVDMPYHLRGTFSIIDHGNLYSLESYRGVYAVTGRDLNGAGLLKYRLPLAEDGYNSYSAEGSLTRIGLRGNYIIPTLLEGSASARTSLQKNYYDMSDYQTATAFQLTPQDRVEVTALGAIDAHVESGVTNFSTNFHGQKIKYQRFISRKMTADVSFVSRFNDQTFIFSQNSFRLTKNIATLTPSFTFEVIDNNFISAGADFHLEKQSSEVTFNSDDFKFDPEPASISRSATYSPGSANGYGGYVRFTGRSGPADYDANLRYDSFAYAEDAVTGSLSGAYRVMPQLSVKAAAGMYVNEVDTLYKVGQQQKTVLEKSTREEIGAEYRFLDDFISELNFFGQQWSNIYYFDIDHSNLYRNDGSAESYGAEIAMLYNIGDTYFRSGFTVQSISSGSAFNGWYDNYILNNAVYLLFRDVRHSIQFSFKGPGRENVLGKPDDIRASVGLVDYRLEYSPEDEFSLIFETGMVLSGNYLFNTETGKSGTNIFTQQYMAELSRRRGSTDLPLHFMLGFRWRLR